jgi:para-nitrobenzyl esterase
VIDGVSVFLGVPYGADTRARRFRAALPPSPWRDIRPAERYGPACPQRAIEESVSEDCLCLNIWTPTPDARARRPVLVYIHGGEYSSGSGSSPLTDGARLCARGDVVVVTLNHRLNIFGHLHLSPFDTRYQGSGNAGLSDLVLALRWVRGNIAAFGGDPASVTLFGQSGGGAKIASLLACAPAQDLFHRVMTMSGQQITVQGPRAAAARTRAVFAALGLTPGDVDGLLAVSAERLVEATRAADPGMIGSTLYFGPVLDEVLLARHPFYPDAPPTGAGIPMIIGNTRDETRGLNGRNDPSLFSLSWDDLTARLEPALFVDIDVTLVIDTYRTLYPNITPSDLFFAATTAGRSWRGALIEAELRAMQGAPAHVYQLDWRSPVDGGKWGAPHTLDIPLVFDTSSVSSSANYAGAGADARRMSALMSEMLLNFARTGTASVVGAPSWAPYTLPARTTMMLDLPPRLENDPRGAERRLFAKAPYIQRGTY